MNHATDVDFVAAFNWSDGGGAGVNVFQALPARGSGHPRFFVLTMGTEAAIPEIPELAARGMDLPSGAQYRWQVHNILPLGSTDDVASEDFLRLVDLRAGDVGETVSEYFYFTTRSGASATVQGPLAPRAGTAADRPRPGYLRRAGTALIP